MRYFLVFLVICTAVFAEQALPSKPSKEKADGQVSGKYVAIGDPKWTPQTVARATNSLFNALQRHDLSTAMLFVSENSLFIHHSLLPINGVAQGKRGFLQQLEKSVNTMHLTDSSFRVLFVDEARGMSIVEKKCSGTFRHNNAAFENLRVMIVIKWKLGKISKANVVELDPTRAYSIFQSKAEKNYMKFLHTLYTCRDACNEIREYLTDDICIKFSNIYPQSLLVPNATGERDLEIKIKGKDNAMKFAAFGNKLYYDLTSSIKILFSNETTVVAAKILKPSENFVALNRKSYLKAVTVLYIVNHFDDKGLIKSAEFYINRPLNPWDIRNMNLIDSEGKKITANELFASIQSAVTV